MKTIGFIGGLGPTSTAMFYNKLISLGCGEFGVNPEIHIHSVQLQQCLELLNEHQHLELANKFEKSFRVLEGNGAEVLFLSSLSMHRAIPFCSNYKDTVVNLISETISAIKEEKVLLLGTQYIVNNPFFLNQFEEAGKHTIIPNENEVDEVERIIKEELNKGVVKQESRGYLVELIGKCVTSGDGAVVLACTALPSLIKPTDISNTLYDPIDIGCKQVISKI